MKDKDKAQGQLMEELKHLRKRVAEFESIATERKREEETLKRLATVVRDSNDAIIIQDIDGRITAWNCGAELMYGYSEAEALEMNIEHLSPPDKVTEQREFTRRLIAGEAVASFETQRVTKDGRILDVWLTVTKLVEVPADSIISTGRDISKPIGVALIERDITERKRMEEDLHKSEERFQALIESSLDVVAVVDAKGTVLYQSPNYASVWGWHSSGESSRDMFKDVHPDDIPLVGDNFVHLLKKPREPIQLQIRAMHTDGTWHNVEVVAHNHLENPAVRGIVVNLRDVTERKKAEEVLRESEEKLRALFETVDVGITVTDMMGKIIDVNETILKMYGFSSKEEVYGRNGLDFISEKDRDRAIQALANTRATGTGLSTELTLLRRDGSEYMGEVSTTVLHDISGNPVSVVVVQRDITERKHMEEELQRKERYFRALIESSSDGIMVLDRKGTIRYESQGCLRLLGYTEEERIGRSVFDPITPEDIEAARSAFAQLVTGLPGRAKLRARHKDGSLRIIEANLGNALDDPSVDGIVVNLRDITERERMEEELRESEEKYSTLVENATDGVAIIQDKIIKFANKRMSEMSGYTVEELTGMSTFNLVPPDFTPALEDRFALRVQGKDAPEIFSSQMLCKDGTVKEMESSTKLIQYKGKLSAIGIIRDITERKQAEEALKKSEERFAKAFKASPEAISISYIENGMYVDVNENFLHTTGFQREDVIGHTSAELHLWVDQNDRSRFREKITSDGYVRDYEVKYRMRSGEIRDFLVSAELINLSGKVCSISFIRDITERKRVEDALIESEEWHRALVETSGHAGIGIAILQSVGDREAAIVFANDQACEVAGYSREELLNLSLMDVIPPDIIGQIMSQYKDRQQGKPVPYYYEAALIRKDKTRVPVITSVATMKLHGKPATVVYFRDITLTKETEKEIIELSNAFGATLDPVLILDMEGNVRNTNDAARRLFETEEVGINALEYVVPEDKEKVAAAIQDLIINGRSAVAQFNVVTRSGRNVPLEASGSLMRDANGKPVGVVVVERELTERKQAESRQKLAAEILGILNEPLALLDTISRILTAIKRETGFYAVGIRLREGDDYPYFVQNGFSEDFLLTENTLVERGPDGGICRDKNGNVSLECTCGLVISGKTDPSNPLFTPGGSAWTSNSIPLLDIPIEQDPRLHPRNRCIHAGFQSVALMPIRSGNKIVGLLQLNDRRKGCFTPEMIRFFEGIAASIGIALMRKQAEEALQKSDIKYRDLFAHTLLGMEVIDGTTGRVLLANHSMARMFGFKSPAEMVGTNPMDYVLLEDLEWIIKQLAQVMTDTEKRDVATVRARTKDGRIIWVTGSTTSFQYEGMPAALISLIDVTVAKEAEDALRKSEERHRMIAEMSQDIICTVDLNGITTYASPAVERVLGYRPDEVVGKSVFGFVADQGKLSDLFTGISGNMIPSIEIEEIRKDGALVYIEYNNVFIKDGEKIIGVLAIGRDVTERKHAEEALLRISKAVESSSDAIGISDAQGHHFYHNQAFTELFEYTPEELEAAGGGPAAYENKNVARKVFGTIMGGGSWIGEVEMVSKSGRKFLVLQRADAIKDESGKVIGLVGVHTDITERKRAEDTLRETRDYMENLIEYANVPMVIWTPDFRITRFNRAFERLTGMKAKAVVGKNLEIMFPEGTRKKSMSYLRSAVSGARWEVVDIPIVNMQGEIKTVLWNISTIYAEDRKTPTAIIAQGQDITERKQAEEALRESEEMSRSMLDNAAMGIYLLQDKKFLYVNPTFEKIMGYSSAELVGQEAINFVHPNDRAIVRISAVENLKGVSTLPYEFRALRKDGQQIWVMERVTSIRYKGKRAVIASFMETTEHRKAEEALESAYEELKTAQDRMVQSEKLRAMGEMASGIAHDFNNMLAVILGRTQLVIDDVRDDKVKKGIQIIEQAALDAAKTVKRLQDFARIRVEHPFESLDVNEVVEVVIRMVEPRVIELEQTKGIAIKVEQKFGEVGQVSGDAAELREALLNILFNAIDAMPTGGKLTVKSEQDKDWVQISIKDTGVGIPDKVKKRVFDPFFTTKASKGSGLGLSVTYGIVSRHGGMIKFDSEVGKGTTFYIRLPLAAEALKKEAKKRKVVAAKPANILAVDDEPEVLKALELTLEYFGHWVKGFTRGAEAIKAFKDGNYDMVITDLGMPEVSGWDVARAIKKIKPDVPLLLITGWVVDLDEEQKKIVDGVISKPFSRDSISSAISQVFPAKKQTRKKKGE